MEGWPSCGVSHSDVIGPISLTTRAGQRKRVLVVPVMDEQDYQDALMAELERESWDLDDDEPDYEPDDADYGRLEELERMPYALYLKSPEWQTKARRIRMRDGCCQDCGGGGLLHVHHLSWASGRGQETGNELIALCPPCHGLRHGRKPRPQDRAFPLPSGDVA